MNQEHETRFPNWTCSSTVNMTSTSSSQQQKQQQQEQQSLPQVHTSSGNKNSPNKYRLWNQSGASQTHARRTQVNVNQNNASLPEDPESDCIDEETFFKYLNLIPTKQFDSALSQHDAPKETSNSKSTTINRPLARWPLRNVSKGNSFKVGSDGHVLIDPLKNSTDAQELISFHQRKMKFHNCLKEQWAREAKLFNDELKAYNSKTFTSDQDKKVKYAELRQKQTKLNHYKKNKLDILEFELKEIGSSIAEKNKLTLKDVMEYYGDIYLPLSSPMGFRVRESILSLDQNLIEVYEKKKFKLVQKIEPYCVTSNELLSTMSVNNVLNKKAASRITRQNYESDDLTMSGSMGSKWGSRKWTHQYCFNRMQRFEKFKTMETGLDWKGRLLAMHCRDCVVELEKISRCPCCLEVIEAKYGHSCQDSDVEYEESEVEEYDDGQRQYFATGDVQVCVFNGEESVSNEVVTAGGSCFYCGSDHGCECDNYIAYEEDANQDVNASVLDELDVSEIDEQLKENERTENNVQFTHSPQQQQQQQTQQVTSDHRSVKRRLENNSNHRDYSLKRTPNIVKKQKKSMKSPLKAVQHEISSQFYMNAEEEDDEIVILQEVFRRDSISTIPTTNLLASPIKTSNCVVTKKLTEGPTCTYRNQNENVDDAINVSRNVTEIAGHSIPTKVLAKLTPNKQKPM